MKLLITGATGTVGAGVLEALESADGGHEIVAASSRPTDRAGWVHLDFLDPSTIGPALEGVNRIFFMRPPSLASASRHFGPFIEALAGLPHLDSVVFLSLQGAESMPWVPHRGIEQALEKAGLPWTFLRPSFFFQNLTGTHGQEIRDTGALVLPAGRGATAFVDTRDIAEAAAAILLDPGPHLHRALELTGRESLRYDEVMEAISRAAGRELTYRPVGFVRFLAHCRRQGRDLPMSLVMCMLYGLCRTGQAGRTSPELEELLGRPPRDLVTFCRDHASLWS